MVPECLETLLFNPRRCFALAPLGLDAHGSWLGPRTRAFWDDLDPCDICEASCALRVCEW